MKLENATLVICLRLRMEPHPPTQLKTWDFVSLTSLVFLSTLVGIYHMFTARKSTNAKDFLVTSSGLGLFPLIFSTVATFWSAIGMLAYPIETYMNGLSFSLTVFPPIICTPFAVVFYLPVFFKLNKSSIFEYLELRFCKSIRICTSVVLTIQTILYTAVVIYVPALALNQVTGLHLWASVVSIGTACIIYTSMGGIKAVVWADVTQFFVMMAVYFMIIIKGSINVGGFGVVWERLKEGNRSQALNWGPSQYSQYTFWTIIVGYTVHFFATITLHQGFMQRFLSNKTLLKAQITYFGGALGVSLGHLVIATVGSLIYATYQNCDQLFSGRVQTRDQMVALFAVETLSFANGLAGVFVAGVMCATLSTLSSTLNSLAAISLSDYVKPFRPNLSDETTIKLSRIFVVFYGVVCVTLVAWAQNMGGVVKASFGASGLTSGPILTVFTIGMFLPWVNSTGATIGFLSSLVVPLWAFLGNAVMAPKVNHAPLSVDGCTNFTTFVNTPSPSFDYYSEMSYLESFYSMHAFWYPCWSLITGVIVSLLVSFITAQDLSKLNPDLLSPIVRNYMLRKKLIQSINNYKQVELVLKSTDDLNKNPVNSPLIFTDHLEKNL